MTSGELPSSHESNPYPLLLQTFMCPSCDKWSPFWSINAKVPRPGTHAKGPPSISQKALLLTANNHPSNNHEYSSDPGATQSSKQSATEVWHTQVRQQGQVMVLMQLQGKHSRQPAWKQVKALGRAVPEILPTVGQYYREVKRGWKYLFSLPFLSLPVWVTNCPQTPLTTVHQVVKKINFWKHWNKARLQLM